MKTFYLFFALMLVSAISFAQNVGINADGSSPDGSAMLDVKSTNSGILIPRMTQAQRDDISSPATGLMVYQTNGTPGFYYYNGSAWTLIGTGSGSESDPVFTASPANDITNTNISNWNIAFGWGNHASAGYLTSLSETDPVFGAHAAYGITGTNMTNWSSAYGWGNHALAGYLTAASLSETDPVFLASPSFGITSDDITTWNGLVSSQWTNSTDDIYFNTGNVAIGTTTPGAYKLNVAGSINGTSVLVNGVAVASSTDTYWETAGSGKIYYNSGNVGIGVANPAYPLDVTGDVNITGNFRVNGTPLTGTGTVTSVSAGNGMNFTAITGSGSVTLGTPSTLTNATTNSVSGTTHAHAITTQLPSSATAGVMLHSGTKTAGGFYGGTTAPSSTTRANYDGYLYATRFYGDGSQLTGISGSATATNLAGGVAGSIPWQSAAGTTGFTAAGTSGYILKSNGTTAPTWLQTLPVANGGTGTTTAPSQGGVIYASSTSAYASTAAGTTGYLLQSNGTSAPSWLSTVPVANGGTGATTTAAARTNLGASTLGGNIFTITNPSAITFPRFNADNTVSALTAADFRTAIGAGTGTGTVTSIATGNGITGGTITTTGTLGLTGQALALHNLATNGIVARTGSGTVSARTISASGNGISVSNGDGVSGNPTVSLSIGTGATQVAAGNHTHSDLGAPVGSIMIWAGSTAPTGWLLCDGTAYTIAAYPTLYAVIGTTYGTGIGFMVPNLKGRIPVGLNSADASFDARGETGGEKTHTLTSAEMAGHTHSVPASSSTTTSTNGSHQHKRTCNYGSGIGSSSSSDYVLYNSDGSSTGNMNIVDAAGDHSHTVTIAASTTGSTGSGTAFTNVQPYIVLNYIIKY